MGTTAKIEAKKPYAQLLRMIQGMKLSQNPERFLEVLFKNVPAQYMGQIQLDPGESWAVSSTETQPQEEASYPPVITAKRPEQQEKVQIENDYLRSLATQERRLAARESQRCDELFKRNDQLLRITEELRRDNAALLEKMAELTDLVRARENQTDRQRFNRLVVEWKTARGHSSKLKDLAMHPAYQQIIGMGERAVPLLLEEMKERPDHWDWALRAITGTDPVPRESWGRLRQIAVAWIEWGTKEGYIK